MIKKRILVSLLAVGLMFVSAPVQTQAAETCRHENAIIYVTKNPTGGYNHTYTAPGGVTTGCAVTFGTYTARSVCQDCGHVSVSYGDYEDHSTNHD